MVKEGRERRDNFDERNKGLRRWQPDEKERHAE
jgi:hypothetical protein